MNAALLGQSLLSGLLSGGLYALLGLGLSLSWRYLRIINLSQFALIFLAAYLTYQFVGPWKLPAFVAPLVLLPAFFVLAALQHLVMIRFKVDEFASVITTFGLTIVVEALIQAIWSADFIRLDVPALRGSMAMGPLLLPQADALMFACAAAVCVAGWAVLRFTYLGKALRAGLENAQIAAVFGVQNQRLSLLVAGRERRDRRARRDLRRPALHPVAQPDVYVARRRSRDGDPRRPRQSARHSRRRAARRRQARR